MIQSCHLDVGFVDLAVNIVNRYFDNFFPEAIAWARDLEAKRSGPKSPGLVSVLHLRVGMAGSLFHGSQAAEGRRSEGLKV